MPLDPPQAITYRFLRCILHEAEGDIDPHHASAGEGLQGQGESTCPTA